MIDFNWMERVGRFTIYKSFIDESPSEVMNIFRSGLIVLFAQLKKDLIEYIAVCENFERLNLEDFEENNIPEYECIFGEKDKTIKFLGFCKKSLFPLKSEKIFHQVKKTENYKKYDA